MGRDKILQHRQPFTEIGDNGCFDDLTGRFGHQTAHAGQLTHLVFASSGTGIGHHVNGVEALFDNRLSFIILCRLTPLFSRWGYFHGFHHFIGHVIGCFGPDIDHLVVFFALGNQALGILTANLGDLSLGFSQDGLFALGGDHGVY